MKFKIALFLGICFGLSACLGGRSADPDFYTLSPIKEKIISDKSVAIGINRVQIARYLDRPQIITQKEGTPEVTISEMNRWIEPLSNLIARTVVTDIKNILPKSVVKTRSIGQENFDYIVSIEIVNMDTILGETTTLNAWWKIYDKDEKLLFRHQMVETSSIGKSYEDLARGQSQLVGKLAVQIAQKISEI